MGKTFCGFRLPLVYDEEADAIYADDVLVAELFADSPKLGHMIAAALELLEALEALADQTGSLLSELEYQQVSCPLCGEDPGEGEDALCGAVKALGEASSKARAAITKAKGGEG